MRKGKAFNIENLRRKPARNKQKIHQFGIISQPVADDGEFLKAALKAVAFAQHQPCSLGARKGQHMLGKGGVVLNKPRESLAGGAKTLFAEIYVDVAQLIFVPERTASVFRNKNPVTVLVNGHFTFKPFAEFACYAAVKFC